jgi:hypothetical protein
MPRHRPPPLVLSSLVLSLGAALPFPARAADPPAQPAAASPSARPSADLARLFRFHATVQALVLREAVDRASFDDALRDELRSLVRDHLKRADDEAGRGPADEPLDDLLDRATALAREFNDKQIADWLDTHPAAYQPVQEQIALAEAFERATADEPDALVRAARAAGLAPDREAVLKRLASDAHDRVAKADEADTKRVRDAQEKAGVPVQPPEPPPGGKGEGGGAAPPPPVPPPGAAAKEPGPPPPPLTPEQRRVQLLDALTLVDARERLSAAARDVRTEVEKMLPEPPQLKALANEMLRWYQTLAPAEDGGREGDRKGSDGTGQSKPGSPQPRPGPGDPKS